MDLNWLLIWMVGATCALMIERGFRSRPIRWRRLALPGGIALLLALTALAVPDYAGFVTAPVCCGLMILPNLGMAWINGLIARKRYRQAALLARVVGSLKPFDGGRELPVMVGALADLDRGRVDEALDRLATIGRSDTATGRMALILRTRRLANWEEFLIVAETWAACCPPVTDPLMLDGYLQALGETGRRGKMLGAYDRIVSGREADLPPVFLNVARAKVAAFAGDVPLTEQTLSGPLHRFPQDFRLYWQGTAMQASGDAVGAGEIWDVLVESADPRIQEAAQRRRRDPVGSVIESPLSEAERDLLERIATTKLAESGYAVVTEAPAGRIWASWTIAAILGLVFLCELPGGSENLDNLVSLGAMVVPVGVRPGEWWRVLSAPFLHYGVWHLLFNVVGLLLLGRRLERVWGSWAALACYLLAACGSIALAPWLMTDATEETPMVLVGASGGVMGTMGGLLVHAGCGALRFRSRIVSNEFQLLLTVILVQTIFDSQTPNVSTACHLLGLGFGIGFGLVAQLPFRRWFPGRRLPRDGAVA